MKIIAEIQYTSGFGFYAMRIITIICLLLTTSTFVLGQTTFKRLSNYKFEKGAQFGWSCAANSDFVITGGHNATSKAFNKTVIEGGEVVIYKQFQGKWVKYQELRNPYIDYYGWFGSDVQLNDKHLVVSASGFSKNENKDHSHREGKVFVYGLNLDIKWQRHFEISSPSPNRSGNFGKIIRLKGDTLAVFYESGDGYYQYPNQQCIAFYNLGSKSLEPFRIVSWPKNKIPIYNFNFDFSHVNLIVGRNCSFKIYRFGAEEKIEEIDSINICSETQVEGRITTVKLHKDNYFLGFHEYMYYFWGYKPIRNIQEGELVIGKTVIDEESGKKKSYILPDDNDLILEYGITPEFFKNHCRVYESYKARAKRKAGAGQVLVYELDENNLKLKQKLIASKQHAEDWFGGEIAISDSNLLISAMGFPDQTQNHDNYNKRFAGAVFHFILDDKGAWREEKIYRSLHRKRWDKFGFSLNNWRDFFVIGCRFDEYDEKTELEQGAVYILNFQ